MRCLRTTENNNWQSDHVRKRGGGPQVGEVTSLGEVTRLSI